jgi:hypothetical protein
VSNLVPHRYRSVSVASVDVPLTEAALRDHFRGREAYRRTAYVVARRGGDMALLQVTKASEEPLFSTIVDVRLLAGPDEAAFVRDPKADTGIPTHLARVAGEAAAGARCVVVHGRYEHVSFILDPEPVAVRVVEVEPPRPAKLVDQVRRVLDVADELPPVDLRPEAIDLMELARTRPSERYLYPCRGSGVAPERAEVRYLDERPPRQDWVLVGCRRSLDIHRWFYGSEPPFVEMCPRELTRPTDVPTLTKCCMLEVGVEREGDLTVVPWGASLDEVREGLRVLLRAAEPAWAPA